MRRIVKGKFFSNIKILEFFNKFSTFQMKIIPPTFTETKNDKGVTSLNLERDGTFYIEVIPHTKDSTEERPARIWDEGLAFALSLQESYQLELGMKQEGKVNFIHKDQKDDTTKTLTFEKIEANSKTAFNIWMNHGEKKNSARLSPAQFGLLVDMMGRLRPTLVAAQEASQPIMYISE